MYLCFGTGLLDLPMIQAIEMNANEFAVLFPVLCSTDSLLDEKMGVILKRDRKKI